jgi:hypothetical protein
MHCGSYKKMPKTCLSSDNIVIILKIYECKNSRKKEEEKRTNGKEAAIPAASRRYNGVEDLGGYA